MGSMDLHTVDPGLLAQGSRLAVGVDDLVDLLAGEAAVLDIGIPHVGQPVRGGDQGLRRMKLDYVDIFYSHRWDPETPIEETMQALVDIVRQGKALYVGLSRYPADKAGEAYEYLAAHDVPCLLYQDRYNIIDRAPQCSGLIDLGKENGVGFISFSPLQQGLLSGRYLNGIPADSRMARGTSLREDVLTPTMLDAIKGLNKVAESRGQSLAQMALSWLLNDTRTTSVIIGASSVAQIQDNLKALENYTFSEEELIKIEELSAPVQLKKLAR